MCIGIWAIIGENSRGHCGESQYEMFLARSGSIRSRVSIYLSIYWSIDLSIYLSICVCMIVKLLQYVIVVYAHLCVSVMPLCFSRFSMNMLSQYHLFILNPVLEPACCCSTQHRNSLVFSPPQKQMKVNRGYPNKYDGPFIHDQEQPSFIGCIKLCSCYMCW